jgi:hypothetical protein
VQYRRKFSYGDSTEARRGAGDDLVEIVHSGGSQIAFYILQILLARAWMTRFSLGPVEWFWRSLTYFKLQPNMHRASAAKRSEIVTPIAK